MPNVEIQAVMLESRAVMAWSRSRLASADTLGAAHGGADQKPMLLLIAANVRFGPEWLNHALKGEWADHGKCSIGGEFLLIYQMEGNQLTFVRAGSHANLLGSQAALT